MLTQLLTLTTTHKFPSLLDFRHACALAPRAAAGIHISTLKKKKRKKKHKNNELNFLMYFFEVPNLTN